MPVVQNALLAVYRGARRSGLLNTHAGRALYERAYWMYKSMVEARDVRSVASLVAAGSTVVDVGANIGFFTVLLARRVGARGLVISIEPEADNFASLQRRVEHLGLDGVVSLVNAAAVENPGQAYLVLNPDNPADHRVADAGVAVSAVSLDALLAERGWPRVSLIKIDVQGGELRVIRGATQALRRFHPTLFVEFHEPSLARAGTSTAELLGELLALGYEPRARSEEAKWIAIDEAAIRYRMAKRGYVDLLLLHGRRDDA